VPDDFNAEKRWKSNPFYRKHLSSAGKKPGFAGKLCREAFIVEDTSGDIDHP